MQPNIQYIANQMNEITKRYYRHEIMVAEAIDETAKLLIENASPELSRLKLCEMCGLWLDSVDGRCECATDEEKAEILAEAKTDDDRRGLND